MTLKQEMPGYFCYIVLLGRQQYVSYHKVAVTGLLAAKKEITKAMGSLTNSETHYILGYHHQQTEVSRQDTRARHQRTLNLQVSQEWFGNNSESLILQTDRK